MATKIEFPTEVLAQRFARALADAAPVSSGYSGLTVTTDADDATIAAVRAQLDAYDPYVAAAASIVSKG